MKLIKKISLINLIFLMNLICQASSEPELKVRLGFRIPVDPLMTKTMADYDLSLILGRTLFNYDDSRNAISGIIKKWSFNSENGEYIFEVDENAKWSDGTNVSSNQVVFNLKRPLLLKTTYGNTLAEIVKLDSIKIKSDRTFSIETVDKKPQKSLFQRLGSVFFTLVHPNDTKDNVMISNTLSCGPYVLESTSSEQLIFKKNKYFINSNQNAANKIVVKRPNPDFKIEDFVQSKTWENLIQTSTLLPADQADVLIRSKLPTWTRGHDRVALLKPIAGKNLSASRELISFINKNKFKLKTKKFTLNVQLADSLQPIGYPLFDNLTSNNIKSLNDIEILNKKFNIVTNKTVSTDFLKNSIEEILQSTGMQINWKILETSEFIKSLNDGSNYDLALFSFGVADPESATWMSLIFNNQFIEIDETDRKQFSKIIKISNPENEVIEFKKLLKSMYNRGSYAPLFHFSTLSIGQKNLDLSNIKTLDETVDYSKVIFRK